MTETETNKQQENNMKGTNEQKRKCPQNISIQYEPEKR